MAGAHHRRAACGWGVIRSKVVSSCSGAAAAQACGEHEVGYGMGTGYSPRGKPHRKLRKAVAEVRGGVEDGLGDPLGVPGEAVPHQAGRAQRVVVRPYRSLW